MFAGILPLVLSFMLGVAPAISAGNHPAQQPQINITHGAAAPGEPFWLESIRHQGTSAYNSDPSYQVFRNVKV
jgi:glucan 1,3-beta-glucosidase